MKVFWTPEAEQDRDEIWNHIAVDNVPAAARLDEQFGSATLYCGTNSMAGAVASMAALPGSSQWSASRKANSAIRYTME